MDSSQVSATGAGAGQARSLGGGPLLSSAPCATSNLTPPTGLLREGRTDVLVLLATLCLGLLARCRFVADVFLPGRILPFDPDSSFHLWRIEEAVRTGVLPHFDPFLNAPYGARVIYPDGYDGLIAALARAFFGEGASRADVQLLAVCTTPLLGSLAILCAYALGRRLVGRGAARWAAFLCAILPAAMQPGMLGLVDHHLFELALPPLALTLLFGAEDGGRWRRAGSALGAALALATLWYTAPATMLHVFVVLVGVGVAAVAHARVSPPRASRLLLGAGAALAVAALLMLPDALGRSGYAYFEPSRLQVVLYGGASLALLLLGWVARVGLRALLLSGAALGVLAVILALTLLDAATAGAGFLSREGVLALVTESAPVWEQPWRAVEVMSLGAPGLPLAFFWAARRTRTPESLALGAVGLSGCLLFALQLRFAVVLVIPAAVVFGAVLHAAFGATRGLRRVLVGALLLGALAPSALFWLDATLIDAEAVAVAETSAFLRAHTPPAGARAERGRAKYSLLTMWGVGNHFAYHAERPVLVGAMYHGDHAHGLRDTLRILHGDEEPTPLLEAREVRYLVLPEPIEAVIGVHRQYLGLSTPRTRPTLHERLFSHGGSAIGDGTGKTLASLGTFREVFRTQVSVGSEPVLKVFERVQGARLRGACARPTVDARQVVPTAGVDGRPFVASALCLGGRFELRLPYAGETQLRSGVGSAHRLTVPVAAVERGDVLEVP